MPVYLFTFHGYRTWMPDHGRGYTRRNEGYCPPDEAMARRYEEHANENEKTVFDAALQRILIEEAQVAACPQRFRLHGAGSDPTHIHYLVSWCDSRHWQRMRTGLKTSLTKRLNVLNEQRAKQGDCDVAPLQLSRGGSRKRVRNRDHYHYLMVRYLPDHRGAGWYEDRGWIE
jgi:hypothetical protein